MLLPISTEFRVIDQIPIGKATVVNLEIMERNRKKRKRKEKATGRSSSMQVSETKKKKTVANPKSTLTTDTDDEAFKLNTGSSMEKVVALLKRYEKEFPHKTPLVCACEKGRFEDVRVLVEAMTWRRQACRWTRWSVRKGRIVWLLTHTLQSAAGRTVGDRPVPRQELPTVDLIGQTNSNGRIVYIMLQYFKEECSNAQFLIENYNGDIKRIINHQEEGWRHTIRLCI